jgi:hypothetical protein
MAGRGEEPLDDHVVQIAGNPLAILEHNQLLALLLRPGPVEGEGGPPGEGRQQHGIVVTHHLPGGLGDDQDPAQSAGAGERNARAGPSGTGASQSRRRLVDRPRSCASPGRTPLRSRFP